MYNYVLKKVSAAGRRRILRRLEKSCYLYFCVSRSWAPKIRVTPVLPGPELPSCVRLACISLCHQEGGSHSFWPSSSAEILNAREACYIINYGSCVILYQCSQPFRPSQLGWGRTDVIAGGRQVAVPGRSR
jgi:hypothetical protein